MPPFVCHSSSVSGTCSLVSSFPDRYVTQTQYILASCTQLCHYNSSQKKKKRSLCIQNSLLPTYCSKFLYGGGGTTGLLLWLGHYMALWPLKSVTKMLVLRYLELVTCHWRCTSKITWVLNMTSFQPLQWPILALFCSSSLCLPMASSSSTSKGDNLLQLYTR